MFESNFPVDKGMCGHVEAWYAFKHIATGASASEKAAPFHYLLGRAVDHIAQQGRIRAFRPPLPKRNVLIGYHGLRRKNCVSQPGSSQVHRGGYHPCQA